MNKRNASTQVNDALIAKLNEIFSARTEEDMGVIMDRQAREALSVRDMVVALETVQPFIPSPVDVDEWKRLHPKERNPWNGLFIADFEAIRSALKSFAGKQ